MTVGCHALFLLEWLRGGSVCSEYRFRLSLLHEEALSQTRTYDWLCDGRSRLGSRLGEGREYAEGGRLLVVVGVRVVVGRSLYPKDSNGKDGSTFFPLFLPDS